MYLKRRSFILSLLFLTFLTNNSNANIIILQNDTSVKVDSTKQEAFLKDNVTYNALDSMQFDIQNEKVLLYGKAFIQYEKTEIKADFIEIDWTKNQVYATGRKDTAGNMVGYPEFKEENESFKAHEMTYNYKSKKCRIKQITTKEGEGYILGKIVKKMENDVFYLHKGDYTTCDAEKPHFSIRAKRIKVIPGKKIVSGPAYLRIFNIPTPLFLPFGYYGPVALINF